MDDTKTEHPKEDLKFCKDLMQKIINTSKKTGEREQAQGLITKIDTAIADIENKNEDTPTKDGLSK